MSTEQEASPNDNVNTNSEVNTPSFEEEPELTPQENGIPENEDSNTNESGSNSSSSTTSSNSNSVSTSNFLNDPNMNTNQNENNIQNETSEESENEDEGTPPEGDTSGVKIAEGSPQEQADDEAEADTALYLGRRLEIVFGPANTKIIGRIYYISENLIRIMPDGASDRLYNFPLVDGGFDPDLGVSEINIGDKVPQQAFVAWQGFRKDQLLLALNENGELIGTYEVISIKEEEDKAVLKNIETSDEEECDFAFEGIPLDKPFTILRIKPTVEEQPTPEQEQLIAEERAIASIPGAKEALERGEDVEFEDLEEFELPDAPEVVYFEDIAKSKQVFPEKSQQSSFMADLASYFDQTSLRNPNVLKKLRILTQLFSNLKNSTIHRNPDGSVVGEAKLSADTMLDVVQDRTVPIVRPVLDTTRVLVSEFAAQEDKKSNEGQIAQRRLDNLVEDSVECIRTLADIPPGEPGVGLPRWHQMLNQYFTKYPVGDEFDFSGYTFQQDSDYFRQEAPGLDTVPGLLKDPRDGDGKPIYGREILDNLITDIYMSYRRARGPTVRALPKGGTELARSGDRAHIKGYVLFPYKVIADGALGASRTGTLWEDMLRNGTERTLVQEIIKRYGGIVQEDLDAQKINYLDTDRPTAVRVSFNEYLKLVLQSLVPRGMGDIHTLKSDLGIEEYEATAEQQQIIDDRVKEVIASVRSLITKLREAAPPPEPQARPLDGNAFLNTLESKIASHPELLNLLKSMQREIPGYGKIDVAVFAYLLVHAQDYILAVLGGNTANLEREQVRFMRDLLLQRMHDLDRTRIRIRNAGEPPKPNPCAHTKELIQVRKASTDNERIVLLSKFLGVYRGGREDNWITCKICKLHLICHHEVLQIQQYLNPREKSGLQKEIILQYSGGTFGKHHICRNCGLPIAELDFDTGLEYDDEGRPMSGRAVIVDKDEAVKEQVDLLLGTKISEPDELKFNTDKKNEYYKIAKVICDYMGFPLSGQALSKLVERAEAYDTSKIMTSLQYDEYSKKQEKKPMPYKKYSAYLKVSLVLAFLFLEIQTAKPDYRISYVVSSCRPSFSGFPLKQTEEPTPETAPGIQYLACAMALMPARTEYPWADSFASIKTVKDRSASIFKEVVSRIKTILKTDSKITELLEEKRKYLEQVFGHKLADGREGEKLPTGFLPRIESAEIAAENAAKSPAIAEGAKKTSEGAAQQADAWIRTANRYARESAIVIRGSPYAESSCCYSSITNPREFWTTKEFPPLPQPPMHDLYFRRKTILFPIYETRPLQEQVFKLSPEEYYKVFLEICWKGPRAGLAHEFGYDYKCDWCDLELPVDYVYPDIFEDNPSWSKNRSKKEREAAALYEQTQIANLKASLSGQGVPFDDETAFRALVAIANARRMFTTYKTPSVDPMAVIQSLLTIDIPPIPTFQEDLTAALDNLKKLDIDSSEDFIFEALKPLTSKVNSSAAIIVTVLDQPKFQIIRDILRLSLTESLEVIRSYFLIPALRILNESYDTERFNTLPSIYTKNRTKTRFHDEHIKGITEQLHFHVNYVNRYRQEIQTNTRAYIKLTNFVDQLICFMNLTDELKISRLYFDEKPISKLHEILLNAILQTTIFGILGTLLNENDLPDVDIDEPITNDPSLTVELLGNYIGSLLTQYRTESISYNPEKVKEKLASEKEIELQGVLGRYNKMTEEERDVERLKQTLKLGRFDIGTKAFKYDADFWEQQRQERIANHSALAMGADGEFVGLAQLDGFGDVIERATEEGYEFDFHPEDAE